MTDPLFIPQSHSPALRLFHLDPAVPRARILAEAPTAPIIAEALGLPALPPGSAEVVRLADIAALGLRGFLVQAHDATPDGLAEDADLDALTGHVLIVHPTIARNGAVTLHPGPGLHLLGAYPTGMPAPTPLHVAPPDLPPGPPARPVPTPRGSGGAVLALLALVLVVGLGLFVYVIGLPG